MGRTACNLPFQGQLDANVGACSDPGKVAVLSQSYGLRPLRPREIERARALAADKISDRIASVDLFGAVQALTQASIFGFTEDARFTGVMAVLPLRQAALPALDAGDFNGAAFDLDLVAPSGEAPAAWYGWGFAASTNAAGRAVVRAGMALQRELYWGVPAFTRAVTAAGARATLLMGYRPLRSSDPLYLWIQARQQNLEKPR